MLAQMRKRAVRQKKTFPSDEVAMQRVTELLQRAGLRGDMPWVSEADMEWYFQRGTMIHKATVLVDTGTLDWDALDTRIVGHVRAYQRFIDEVRPLVCESEQEVVSKKWDYIGHLDRVYRIAGRPVVCDIKTSAVDLPTRLQTMAYMLARHGGKRLARMGLALHSDGTYKATWWRSSIDYGIDMNGWVLGVLPNNPLEIRYWKRRVGMKETV